MQPAFCISTILKKERTLWGKNRTLFPVYQRHRYGPGHFHRKLWYSPIHRLASFWDEAIQARRKKALNKLSGAIKECLMKLVNKPCDL